MARPLYGIPDEVLLAERRKAQEQLMRGSVVTGIGNESGNSQLLVASHIRQRIDDINAELIARNHPEAPREHLDKRDFVTVGFN